MINVLSTFKGATNIPRGDDTKVADTEGLTSPVEKLVKGVTPVDRLDCFKSQRLRAGFFAFQPASTRCWLTIFTKVLTDVFVFGVGSLAEIGVGQVSNEGLRVPPTWIQDTAVRRSKGEKFDS